MQTTDLSSAIPLTETTMLILLSLAEEPRHGYAIMKDVERLSQERVHLSTGTLYGALKRLLDQGWIIRSEDVHEENGPGRARKAYSLSPFGKRVLQAEIDRLGSLVKQARLRTQDAQA
jgi:DNA-binding PadR family transcriptional regulator